MFHTQISSWIFSDKNIIDSTRRPYASRREGMCVGTWGTCAYWTFLNIRKDDCWDIINLFLYPSWNIPYFPRIRGFPFFFGFSHASHMTLFNNKKAICAQGPLKCTATDFWRMIWQEDSRLVVMLCDFVSLSSPLPFNLRSVFLCVSDGRMQRQVLQILWGKSQLSSGLRSVLHQDSVCGLEGPRQRHQNCHQNLRSEERRRHETDAPHTLRLLARQVLSSLAA